MPPSRLPTEPVRDMHLGLIGCSSAGKTTLARTIVSVCRERGIPAYLSEDFAMRRLGLRWIGSQFLRRRVLEVASFVWLLVGWRRHRRYLALVRRVIADAPGGGAYRLGLARLTVRKLGIHALIDGAVPPDHVVVSDNEATLQAAHHLFVHPSQADVRSGNHALADIIAELAELSPRPDLVAYVRVPEAELVERILRRGHRRLGVTSREGVTRFVKSAVRTFETLRDSSAAEDYLFVVELPVRRGVEEGTRGAREWPPEVEPFLPAALEVLSRRVWAHQPDDPRAGSELVGELITRLNRDCVSYCLVENGYAQTRCNGTGRCLALLVDDSDRSSCIRAIEGLGFKEAFEVGTPPSPSAPVHLGLDESTGELICVRVATQAAFRTGTGRGYRIPIEPLLLNETGTRGGARVPSDGTALVLLLLRSFIELGAGWDIRSWAAEEEERRRELRWLAMRCSIGEALRLVDAYCPWVGEVLFLECLNAMFEGRSRVYLLGLSRRVRRGLRGLSRAGWIGDAPAESPSWLSARPTTRYATRWTPPSGGALVAFVGPDATGKSTLAGDVASCLRPHLQVEEVHLGKPRGTAWTWGLNAAVKLRRRVRGRRPRWRPESLPDAGAERGRSVGPAALLYAIRAVALAFDRRRALLAAARSSRRGAVVLCDRYPNRVAGAMDGPRLDADARGRGVLAGPYRMLARLERRLYDGLPCPDVLIRLSVSLEEARRRNRERAKADKHTEAELDERHRLPVVAWPVSEERIREVDTGRSLEESRLAARMAVWAAL